MKKRSGGTVTFSVSVDVETKNALKAVAKRDFQGNMSALVTAMANHAKRALAAGEFLRASGIPRMTAEEADTFEAELAAEVDVQKKRTRKRRAA